MALRPSHLPTRLATGAFILNSGLSKRGARGQEAEQLHGFAKTAYPQSDVVESEQFVKLLSTFEIVLGTALLLPFIPSRLVAVPMIAFSAGLNWLYLKAPGLREEGSLRPTSNGIGIAKDVWMTAIGVSLLISGSRNPERGS